MSVDREYHELYDRLLAEVAALHQSNRRRIRNGMRMLVVVTVGLMLLMFLAEGNKVFTLMLWIVSMFGVAAYLIAVEYADYELQKKLEQITQMEQESMGALLELPELPRMPRLPGRLRRGQREEGSREETSVRTERAELPREEDEALPREEDAALPRQENEAEETSYTVEQILSEVHDGTATKPPVASPVLERLLQDPEKLADDLTLLTQALQNLSDDLRRSADSGEKGKVDE